MRIHRARLYDMYFNYFTKMKLLHLFICTLVFTNGRQRSFYGSFKRRQYRYMGIIKIEFARRQRLQVLQNGVRLCIQVS